jgi:hypothetical protein
VGILSATVWVFFWFQISLFYFTVFNFVVGGVFVFLLLFLDFEFDFARCSKWSSCLSEGVCVQKSDATPKAQLWVGLQA